MRDLICSITAPISELVFPPVCACCGDRLIDSTDSICVDCLSLRFERASNSETDILPDSVSFRLTLWTFDKYGYLQALLHKLKYDHCTAIGVQLGKEAGRMLNKSVHIDRRENWRLLPVPLHRKRYRSRGYNQSMEIAIGVSHTSGLELLSDVTVTRVKHTKTQTGLNSSERASNISGAFEIRNPADIQGYRILLIDDVFTTGATTFELARTVEAVSGHPCGILTIAKA